MSPEAQRSCFALGSPITPDISHPRRIQRVSTIHCVVLIAVFGAGCHAVPKADFPAAPAEPGSRPAVQKSESVVDPDVTRAQNEADERAPAVTAENAPRGRFGLPALKELLDDTPEPDSVEFPSARDDPEEPNIRKPGPDTANFPNAAFTLPQGRLYIEASPLFLSGASKASPKTYNAEFLIRYGLTDRVELRLFGNGPTFETGQSASNGFAPLAYDIKTNLWQENRKYWIPAVGLEVFLLTASGSKSLNQGTQPSINLLFDHTLPWGFQLEWNVGLVGDPSKNNNFSAIEPAVAWALQHEILEDFDVFFQGYFNGPTLPRFGDGIVLGGGAVWAPTRRISFFGSYNLGLTAAAPNSLAQFGGAVAF